MYIYTIYTRIYISPPLDEASVRSLGFFKKFPPFSISDQISFRPVVAMNYSRRKFHANSTSEHSRIEQSKKERERETQNRKREKRRKKVPPLQFANVHLRLTCERMEGYNLSVGARGPSSHIICIAI